MLPNERGEPLPIASTIPRLTPHPVTVGAFLFLRHGKTIRSIPRTRFCCPKTGGWRFRFVFERNERNRKSTLPPRQKKKSKSFPAGVRLRPVLVDPRGVEPLSENPLGRLSSWAVCYLISRGVAQTDTRHLAAALFWMTGSRTNHRCTYPADLTHRGEPQDSHRVRVALRHSAAVRQPERLFYRLRLILGWTVYRDYPARHAYLASEPPSKPLRAQRTKS